MAYFALLWKARTIEKYRSNYEKQKLYSMRLSETQNPKKTFYQKLQLYNCNTKKKLSQNFKKWFPEGSTMHGFFYYMTTDQTFPNFVLKSIIGFVGGIILTYLCFMFFVFQLAISLIHATIMSSIIGVLLTLGLAFSYRIRCLVFLLIPQFFSRVGRYTLTCYALVLILTGPATNTLKNSEVLTESMACKQEQIKSSVTQANESMQKPFNALKDSIQILINKVKEVASKMNTVVIVLHRLVMSMGVQDCQAALGARLNWACNTAQIANIVCIAVEPLKNICVFIEFINSNVVGSVESKLSSFEEHLQSMLKLEVKFHHSYSFSSNTSRHPSQVAAGVVTEIRRHADPLLTWLSWSSCVTSLFLLLIIFRAKHYQNMFETRSRFDNRYITKELRELDLKRMRQHRETILPLNRREKAKYITTTSFRLVSSERIHLSRSAVFMVVTTVKLMIHMVADYSLYWVLMMIRHHGRLQTPFKMGVEDPSIIVTGTGMLSRFMKAIISSLRAPLETPPHSPISCLPDPYPPDFRRYAQIGILIFLLWFFAIFEPYGLRLRHVIMGLYRPERAKARAAWLYNHIQRTRGGFMKYARRKLHRENKYSSEAKYTFRNWLDSHIPCNWLKLLLGVGPGNPCCLLCGTIEYCNDPDTYLVRCTTPNCPGTYCTRCFCDIGNLCTICLSPADYGDLSDISLEKGSPDEDSTDDCINSLGGTDSDDSGPDYDANCPCSAQYNPKKLDRNRPTYFKTKDKEKYCQEFRKRNDDDARDNVPLLNNSDSDTDFENLGEERQLSKAMTKRHNRYSELKVKCDRDHENATQSYSNTTVCLYCAPENKDCVREENSLCLLKSELKKAIIKANVKNNRFCDAKNDANVRCDKQSKNLDVQSSSSQLTPNWASEISGTTDDSSETKSVRNLIRKKKRNSCYSLSFKRRSSYYNLPFNSEYCVYYFENRVCVSKIFNVNQSSRQRSNWKIILKPRKTRKLVFRKWILHFIKHCRFRRCTFNRKSKEKYKTLNDDKNNKTTPKKEETVSLSENDKSIHGNVKKNTSPKKGKIVSSIKLLGRQRRLRFGITYKKHGNNSSSIKCVIPETKKQVNYCRTDDTPYEYERTNHKRRKKLLKCKKIKEKASIISQNNEQVRQDNEATRKYRISSYLSEQDWMKSSYVKDLTPRETQIDFIKHDMCQQMGDSVNFTKQELSDQVQDSEIGDHNTKTKDVGIITKNVLENYDIADNVKHFMESKSQVARSSISMDVIHKKLYNSLEIQLSSSSSNYLSHADQLIAAAATSPRETVDSYKFNTTQTLDYDMSRSMNYYKSIGMKDFDLENEQLPSLETYEIQLGQDDQKPSTSYDRATMQDFISDQKVSLHASECSKNPGEIEMSSIQYSDVPKVSSDVVKHKTKLFPKILSKFATLYSCIFKKKKRSSSAEEELQLVKVDEEVTAYPAVKSRACQHFNMESPRSSSKKPITKQPTTLVNTAQSVSHEELLDAQVNAVQPTCTCATQSIIHKQEASTVCRYKRRKYCKKHGTIRKKDEGDLKDVTVATTLTDCMKKTNNFGVQCNCDEKQKHPGKSQESPPPTHRQKQQIYVSSNSETSYSGAKTDTTICTATIPTINNVDEETKIRNRKTNVVKKTNRKITQNSRNRYFDVSTVTSDWWSPILERKNRKYQHPTGDWRTKRRSKSPVDMKDKCTYTADKAVTFQTDAQIIPDREVQDLDVMSPSRYQSQRYYNELFRSNATAAAAHPKGRRKKLKVRWVGHVEDNEKQNLPQHHGNTKQVMTIKRLNHNKQQIPDRDPVVLKCGEHDPVRGCASSDHVSLECRCNSTDTLGSV